MKFFIIIKENSTRVPGKNFRELGGVPLWLHMMNTLKGEEVYIDTDSKRVIEFSQSLEGVYAYARDQKHIELETDKEFAVSPVLLMIERFLDEHVEDENEVIVTPHVTSPFITLETIRDAAKKLDEGYETVQACTEHKEFAYFYDDPVNFTEGSVMKTQDLTPIKLGNGAFFIFTKKSFKLFKDRSAPGKRKYLYPLCFKEAIEIDTEEDFEIAERFVE